MKLSITKKGLKLKDEKGKEIPMNEIKDRLKWNKDFIKSKIPFRNKLRIAKQDKIKLIKKPETSFFITMFFPNGTYKEFIVIGENVTFKYKGKTFHLDTKEAWFDLTQNQFRLCYYFEYATPISKTIKPINKNIKIWTDEGNEIYLNIKSDNVQPLIEQQYVKVLASSGIDLYLKLTLLFQAFCLMATIMLVIVIFFLARNISKVVKL